MQPELHSMKNNLLIPAILLLTLVLSCASKQEMQNSDSIGGPADAAKSQLSAMPTTDLYSNGVTKLIKTANYRFEVDNVKKSAAAIETAIKKYPAYISASDMRLENPILENKMTIRVQNEFFQDLLKEIDQQARYVNHRDVKTEDVAKQFVDLESRLKTKREVEERYMEILRKKAGTIEELLNAEKQIGELHEDIEATISRINYLKDEVRYSTIELEFYQIISQEIAIANGPSTGHQFGKAFIAGWDGMIQIIIALLYLWPAFLISVTVVLIYRYIKRNKRAGIEQSIS